MSAPDPPHPLTALTFLLVCVGLVISVRSCSVLSAIDRRSGAIAVRLDSIEGKTDAVRDSFTPLQAELVQLRKDLSELRERLPARSSRESGGASVMDLSLVPPPVPVAGFADGFYTLGREITLLRPHRGGYSTQFTNDYTIYALKTTLRAGGKELSLVAGVAVCLGTPVLFVDYNGDRGIDFDVMGSFAESIPGGGIVTGTMNARNSQLVYNAFLADAGNAQFVPQADVTSAPGRWGRSLYEVVQEKAEMLLSRGEEEAGRDMIEGEAEQAVPGEPR